MHFINLRIFTKFCVARMTYAFSRDGALPLSKLWHKVNRHEVPINAVWLSAFMAFVMTLPVSSPLLGSSHQSSQSTFIFVDLSWIPVDHANLCACVGCGSLWAAWWASKPWCPSPQWEPTSPTPSPSSSASLSPTELL